MFSNIAIVKYSFGMNEMVFYFTITDYTKSENVKMKQKYNVEDT